MSRYSREGRCESCSEGFRYFLLHTEENAAGYAYCESCGATALCSRGSFPDGISCVAGAPLAPQALAHLRGCDCGGSYQVGAAPRCPSCSAPLDPELAAPWLEKNRRRPGWTWQNSWTGVYCIVIENRLASDPWRADR